MAGEFMGLMDGLTKFTLGILSFLGFMLILIFIVGPYWGLQSAKDALKRATGTTRVWICEVNSAFYWNQDTGCYSDIDNFKSELSPPFPFVDGKGTGCPARYYYACVGSVKDAENWLLNRGYKKTTIETDSISSSSRPENELKQFFIRNTPGTKIYSVIGLLIDYGDYDIHLFPFSYPAGDRLVDFSKFAIEDYKATGGKKTINVPHTQYCINVIPPLLWKSTDGSSSHMSGGRGRGNNETILEYDKEYGMRRYIELVK